MKNSLVFISITFIISSCTLRKIHRQHFKTFETTYRFNKKELGKGFYAAITFDKFNRVYSSYYHHHYLPKSFVRFGLYKKGLGDTVFIYSPNYYNLGMVKPTLFENRSYLSQDSIYIKVIKNESEDFDSTIFKYGNVIISCEQDTLISFLKTEETLIDKFQYHSRIYEQVQICNNANYYEISFTMRNPYIHGFYDYYPIGIDANLIRVDTVFIENNKRLRFSKDEKHRAKKSNRLVDRVERNRAEDVVSNTEWVRHFEKLYREQFPNNK
ncbi:MAG: hypothetical protein ACLGGV_08870 [Bacteroidia bacterium]